MEANGDAAQQQPQILSNGAGMNGTTHNGIDGPVIQQIIKALEVIHSPQSSNLLRKEAGEFLEQAKSEREAPYHGYTLANDPNQLPAVRHFGLGLLAHAIRYNWLDYGLEESVTVREWVVTLAQTADPKDPTYIRNKIAQLWVEVAKKSWASEWMDMDGNLVRLWETDLHRRDLCMYILESLVEDIFNREDSQTDPRTNTLHKACVDIFTPHHVLVACYPQRENKMDLRCGNEGWLARLVMQLQECLNAGIADDKAESYASQVLATIRSCMLWAIPKSIIETNVVDALGRSMLYDNAQLRIIAIEALDTLFSRTFLDDEDFQRILGPLYQTGTVKELRRVLSTISIDAEAPDEDQYLFLKKFADMIANLGILIEEKYNTLPTDADIPEFMGLLFDFSKQPSLSVSCPNINAWARMLRKDGLRDLPATLSFMPMLLELCDERLLRYELLPQDSQNPSSLLLMEDFETTPERHAFLGNYRRYLSSIIDSLVRRRPFEVFPHILQQLDSAIRAMVGSMAPVQIENYVKNSDFYLKVDSRFTVVESALKGYIRWFTNLTPETSRECHEQSTQFERNLTGWCEGLLTLEFQDPLVRKRVVQLLVALSTTALDNQPGLMLKVLEYILLTRLSDNTANPTYNEAVKDLQSTCISELQRLAMRMPDNLILVYDQLEMKINEIMSTQQLDDRHQLAYRTFLFSIVLRTRHIDDSVRLARLESHLTPICQAWTRPELTTALSTFDGFCDLLMLNQVEQYLHSRNAHQIGEWSRHQLDPEGQALQAQLTEKYNVLPLRATKGYLAISADKIKKPSATYNISCVLWRDKMTAILPNLLKFLGYAHAFHAPKNWSNLPQELHPVMQRVLTDRFWQSGISSGSRDEFYENVSKTKFTMEGFASSIRGTIRTIRETCYSILWAMSKLNISFYDYAELPGPLTMAMFADADALSSHQMTTLINISRVIIDECPQPLRQHFLTPFLSNMFLQIDKKVSTEWHRLVDAKLIGNSAEDKLAVEMKEESVLRQLTYTAVLVVAQLLDPSRQEGNPDSEETSQQESMTKAEGQMREFLLSSNVILEPLIMFCTHALGMKDSRCCGIIIRVFRSVIPEFVDTTRPELREFMCREVFMASIRSFNDDYFVDVQKDLAQLIVQIYLLYSPYTDTPRSLLLTIPGITEHKVTIFHRRVIASANVRVQRQLMLDLLSDVRGVAISEKGKVIIPKAKEKSMAEKEKEKKAAIEREREAMERRSPDFNGVADMFS